MIVSYLLLAMSLACAFAEGAPGQQPRDCHYECKNNAKGDGNNEGVDVQTIVIRLQKAQDENRGNLRAYTVIREYRLFSDSKRAANSQVTAQVNFVPPDVKHYVIKNAEGSDRGEKIVRKILDGETRFSRENGKSRDLIPENYNFTFEGTADVDGQPCDVLGLHPKNRDEGLLEGKVWVDEKSYLPRKVDGDMSENPSWWLKRVHLTLTFNEIEGMWLQTGTQAIAEVRLFGKHTLTSKAVNYQTSEVLAQNRVPGAGSFAQGSMVHVVQLVQSAPPGPDRRHPSSGIGR